MPNRNSSEPVLNRVEASYVMNVRHIVIIIFNCYNMLIEYINFKLQLMSCNLILSRDPLSLNPAPLKNQEKILDALWKYFP